MWWMAEKLSAIRSEALASGFDLFDIHYDDLKDSIEEEEDGDTGRLVLRRVTVKVTGMEREFSFSDARAILRSMPKPRLPW